jgi:beta-lactamase regulating signal transducer with metallopeptidase domain
VIFVARAILVSLAFFAVAYSLLSLTLVMLWRIWKFAGWRKPASPNILFSLRLVPFVLGAAFSLFLTFPSFLLLENHAMDEDFGTFALGICSAVFIGAGAYRFAKAQTNTRRVVSGFLQETKEVKPNEAAPTVIVQQRNLPIMLVGIRHPKVLVSDAVQSILTKSEFRVAVRHEMEHLRSRDNLKRAIVSCVPFPGLKTLVSAWHEASELAADHGAVASSHEALDLAAALVKLSRNFSAHDLPALATGLVANTGSVQTRVQHLLTWTAPTNVGRRYRRLFVALGFAVIVSLTLNIGPTLAFAHYLTERLVP